MQVLLQVSEPQRLISRLNNLSASINCCTLFDPAYNILFTTTDCIIHTVQHPGLIILNYPINGDTVPPSLAEFTWTNATSSVVSLNPKYSINIVPIYDKQSPEEAIAVNPGFWNATDIFNSHYDYPQVEKPFDTIQTYAWQVTAYTETRSTTTDDMGGTINPKSNQQGILVLGKSEVEYFVCADPIVQKKKKSSAAIPSKYYIELDGMGAHPQLYFFDNIVPVMINNRYNNLNIVCKLYDDSHNEVPSSLKRTPIQRGLNKIEVDYSEQNLTRGKNYFLQIDVSENERFEIPLYLKK